MSVEIIRVYVCPNPDCNNYYGTSSMGKLENEPNIAPPESNKAGEVVSYRNKCPDCGENRIERYAKLIDADDVAQIRGKIAWEIQRKEIGPIASSSP